MYRKLVITSLILVYLVIIAGAVVRMTGSGMGCPDWPKCFGYVIPPTELEELQWAPHKSFKEGQVIIVDETLQVATKDFITSTTYISKNWNSYDKHDYAIFNPTHTWIEYINRLVGALAGLAVFIMALVAIFKAHSLKEKILCWLAVFLMGFQGWLGATVVYSVLSPYRITIHMLVALVIVALLIYLYSLSRKRINPNPYNYIFNTGVLLALVLSFIQIALGTQVRQFVDEQVTAWGYDAKELWLNNPNWEFYAHRSFSIAVVILNGYLFYINRRFKLEFSTINWVLFLIIIEVISGMMMYYLDFPYLTQPVHLIIASILFGLQFYLWLISRKYYISSRYTAPV